MTMRSPVTHIINRKMLLGFAELPGSRAMHVFLYDLIIFEKGLT